MQTQPKSPLKFPWECLDTKYGKQHGATVQPIHALEREATFERVIIQRDI